MTESHILFLCFIFRFVFFTLYSDCFFQILWWIWLLDECDYRMNVWMNWTEKSKKNHADSKIPFDSWSVNVGEVVSEQDARGVFFSGVVEFAQLGVVLELLVELFFFEFYLADHGIVLHLLAWVWWRCVEHWCCCFFYKRNYYQILL